MKLKKITWEIVLSSADIDLENPTKEEIIDLITAALPYKEIESQLIRLAVHFTKEILYQKSTRSWSLSIKDSFSKIKRYNTRRKAKGTYFTEIEMKDMLKDEWQNVLTWVAKESNGQYTKEEIKKQVPFSIIWKEISRRF